MEIVTTTPIPSEYLSRDGRAADFTWPSVIDSRVFYNAYWYDWESQQSSGGTALLTFDATATRPAPTLLEDDRCPATSTVAPFRDPQGRIHAVGDGMGGELKLVGARDEQCVLRAIVGAGSFDADYRVDLDRPTQALAFSVGWSLPGISVLVAKVWSPAEATTLPLADLTPFFDTYEFSWILVDMTTGKTVPVQDIPQGGWGNLTPLELDGVRYVQNYPPKAADDTYPEATLYAVYEDGSAKAVLRAGASSDFEMIGRISRAR
jgi:hypothetical protein